MESGGQTIITQEDALLSDEDENNSKKEEVTSEDRQQQQLPQPPQPQVIASVVCQKKPGLKQKKEDVTAAGDNHQVLLERLEKELTEATSSAGAALVTGRGLSKNRPNNRNTAEQHSQDYHQWDDMTQAITESAAMPQPGAQVVPGIAHEGTDRVSSSPPPITALLPHQPAPPLAVSTDTMGGNIVERGSNPGQPLAFTTGAGTEFSTDIDNLDDDTGTMAVAVGVSQEEMEEEIRRQIMENAVVGTPIPTTDVLSEPKHMSLNQVTETTESTRFCDFSRRKIFCAAACIAILVLIGLGVGLAFSIPQIRSEGSTSHTSDTSDESTKDPAIQNTTITTSVESTKDPAIQNATITTVSYYWQSEMAPNDPIGGGEFSHFEEVGYTPSDESRIHKISQIKVYTSVACVTNNNCSLPTATVLSLVVSYTLKDCSIMTQTNGAYTEEGRVPAGTINLRSNQYVTRIEILVEDEFQRIAHMKICTIDEECYCPYGTSLDIEPTHVFQNDHEDGGVIHSFYGYSGSWLDNLGVYYETVIGEEGGIPEILRCV